MLTRFALLLLTGVYIQCIWAQDADTLTSPGSGGDTVSLPPDTAFGDTVEQLDTLTDTTAFLSDTAVSDTSKLLIEEGVQRLKVARRDYTYRKQLGYALGMMAFIALILTSTQSWNPD